MKVDFEQPDLQRVYAEMAFTGGFPAAVARAFRGRIQALQAAPRENAMVSLHSPQVTGRNGGTDEYSMRVNDEGDLGVSFQDVDEGRTGVVKKLVKREVDKE